MRCVVSSCTSNYKKARDVSFFSFPADEAVLEKWIQFSGRRDFNPKNATICSKHFTTDDFENKMQYDLGFAKKRYLTPNAIPTITVCDSTNQESCDLSQQDENDPKNVNELLQAGKYRTSKGFFQTKFKYKDETTSQRRRRLAKKRQRYLEQRAKETAVERTIRLEKKREQNQRVRSRETPMQREQRLRKQRQRYLERRGLIPKRTTPEFDPSLTEEERRFYIKAYPNVDLVRERKVHCTVCKMHIGTAPVAENNIKMHPILRVTHCNKCHDFYNSGEFSKGEDGSELYCRWCGQGGEVYCCSNCPYVFCKSCIVKNLSRGVVADIEQNENWNCFSCAPKILWPLRAQHWALIHYIEKQKNTILALNTTKTEERYLLAQDRSTCCRLSKTKCGNMSDSMESLESATSRRSYGSGSSAKKASKSQSSPSAAPAAKRQKTSNDEVVCTPDLLSMLEPDCQITVQPKMRPIIPSQSTTPKLVSVQSGYNTINPAVKNSTPPPLVLRNTGLPVRQQSPLPVVRRTIIPGPRTPSSISSPTNGPVYHTINGFRIDLNSAAQQETFRLPNGKLIQVKRQGALNNPNVAAGSSGNNWAQHQSQQRTVVPIHNLGNRPIQITPATAQVQHNYVTVQQNSNLVGQMGHQMTQQHQQQVMRFHNTTVTPISHNGGQIQLVNGVPPAPPATITPVAKTPLMVRHAFPDTAIGQARSQLQDQVFNAMEICQHLTGKIQTLTNSNAYKQARNYLEIKELYIHLSYLLTYAIGRFKGLQDKCLGDMRQLGFANDADSLENGQLAAGVDYVRYGQLDDVDLFNTGSNSFHNQVYEYRKSLYANMKQNGGEKRPLSPLMPLGQSNYNDADDDDDVNEQSKDVHAIYNDTQDVDENDEPEEPYFDDDQQDEGEIEADVDDGELDAEAEGNYYGSDNRFQGRSAHNAPEQFGRDERSRSNDRKLTRLIQQYPSIWCTRHPDYGNFEVTRRQWNIISSHFKRSDNIKLRWKNIRKRFVRIERRISDGKRFNGYFDKATNFLTNRDLPEEEWIEVDCGNGDGDVYERKKLDAIEQKMYPNDNKETRHREQYWKGYDDSMNANSKNYKDDPSQPLEICGLDLKIINFVKCNPVLWRKSPDLSYNRIDEQTRKSLWSHLWKSLPNLKLEDIMDRWSQLYEMYKAFRLKTIKNEQKLADLELKYSKYLAKLYFLYKIDEDELRNENLVMIDFDECDTYPDSDNMLLDMPDDKGFMLQLVRAIERYPTLWNKHDGDYYDTVLRENIWHDIAAELSDYKHKQASDDEDNEIMIVEPKTDTITLDSDNEDEPPPKASSSDVENKRPVISSVENRPMIEDVTSTMSQNFVNGLKGITDEQNSNTLPENGEEHDFAQSAHDFLASLLEVDMIEDGQPVQKKQPRKKTTNKPNPTLIKQKEMLERERLNEIKRNDIKLKMDCTVELKRAEDEFPIAAKLLEYKRKASSINREDVDAVHKNKEGIETDDKNKTADSVSNTSAEEQVELLEVIDMDSSLEDAKTSEKDVVAKVDDKNNGESKEIIIQILNDSLSDEKETANEIEQISASCTTSENDTEEVTEVKRAETIGRKNTFDDNKIEIETSNKNEKATTVNEVKIDDTKVDEVEIDDTKVDEMEIEDTKVDEMKIDDTNADEVKIDDTKVDEMKIDDPKVDKVKIDDTTVDEVKIDDTKVDEVKIDDTIVDEMEIDDTTVDEVEIDNTTVDEVEMNASTAADTTTLGNLETVNKSNESSEPVVDVTEGVTTETSTGNRDKDAVVDITTDSDVNNLCKAIVAPSQEVMDCDDNSAVPTKDKCDTETSNTLQTAKESKTSVLSDGDDVADDGDIDVDKEIDKLLHGQSKIEYEANDNTVEVMNTNNEDKQIKMPTESPDILNEISELLEKGSNVET